MHKSENLQIDTLLNEIYRFDNFVIDNLNQDALSAAFFLSCLPGEKLFNPFLIYGGSGSRKNHLTHVIGNALFFVL